MILFIAAEVMEGQLNVPALDPVGVPGNRWANVKFFDLYHFTYYWFGFWFCNLIWYDLHVLLYDCRYLELAYIIHYIMMRVCGMVYYRLYSVALMI
jgi:hypothetical protein